MRRIKSLLVAFAWRSMISALMSESITTGATSMRKSMHFQATERTCTGIGGGGGGGGIPMITIDVGTRAMQSSNRDLVGIMDDMSVMEPPAGGAEEDDLLDLLDAAN
mmetsp:Transcript_33197/g.82857  ORF Transcript_33197/g.82857 Transcript_33197/m.82857 type:complete len:107 (-) Transcript_33197:430-750(-)